MKEQTKGILKITEGWLKRAIGIAPFVILVAGFGAALGCGIASLAKDDDFISQYQQKQSYVEHIAEEKAKLLDELSKGMSWQEYNSKNKELDSKDYARDFLKATDEDFNKDYKLIEKLNIAFGVESGVFVFAGVISLVQAATSEYHDSYLTDSAERDIEEGKMLLEEAKKSKTYLPPDENNFDSIEDEYK